MADTPEDDELLLEDKAEGEEPETDETEEKEQPSNEPGDVGEDEGDEILIGDEAAPASGERETGLVKHLREEVRRRDQRIAELAKAQPPQQIEVGPEPTLEGCEWDEDRFRTATREWLKRQEEVEKAKSTVQQQEHAAAEAWQADVRRFEARKAELRVPDAEGAIETAMAALNQVQQAVIVKAADNPALVFAALGKHPGKLAEIASISDPLKQAAAVAKLEGTLKVAPRRKAPEPEQVERGNASVRHEGADKKLERLEAEAARNGGDRSKIIAYKAQLKSQAKS